MLNRVADALEANEQHIMEENAKASAFARQQSRWSAGNAGDSLLHATAPAVAPAAAPHACCMRALLHARSAWHCCSARAALLTRPPPLAAAAQDVAEAQGKISDSLLQRLILKHQKIAQLAQGIRAIAAQDEPIRHVLQRLEVAEGALRIGQLKHITYGSVSMLVGGHVEKLFEAAWPVSTDLPLPTATDPPPQAWCWRSRPRPSACCW